MTWKLYIICFDRRLKHTKHYVGIAKCPSKRLKKHKTVDGAKIMQAVLKEGIPVKQYVLSEHPDYMAARLTEKDVKKQKNHVRFCPRCMDT